MYRIEDITSFYGSLTFDMVKMFKYFESPSYVILLNSFYFSIFFSHGNVLGPCLQLGMSENVQN